MVRSVHDVNEEFESDYDNPLYIQGSYRIFFRGYIASPTSNRVVGLTLAWKDSHSTYYAALVGSPWCGSYKSGEIIPHVDEVHTSAQSSAVELRTAVLESIDRMKSLLTGLGYV